MYKCNVCQSWARDNCLASRQPQRDYVIETQGQEKKFKNTKGLGVYKELPQRL